MVFSLEDLTKMTAKLEKLKKTWISCGNLVQTVRPTRSNRNCMVISKNIAAGVIYAGAFGSERTYHTPDGFCFDLLCTDDAINDNPNDGGYNLDSKVNQIVILCDPLDQIVAGCQFCRNSQKLRKLLQNKQHHHHNGWRFLSSGGRYQL